MVIEAETNSLGHTVFSAPTPARCDTVYNFSSDLNTVCGPQCPNDAVIRYDGENRCKEHADPNVLALLDGARKVVDEGYFEAYLSGPIAALEPRDE